MPGRERAVGDRRADARVDLVTQDHPADEFDRGERRTHLNEWYGPLSCRDRGKPGIDGLPVAAQTCGLTNGAPAVNACAAKRTPIRS